MNIHIINPDNGKPVTIDEWRKDKNPTRARIIVIDTDEGHTILMNKEYLPGKYNWEEAQKACGNFLPAELQSTGVIFRCPTRKECIDLYDARFQGLDEAIALIGGNFAQTDRAHWTCERDANPRCGADSAWCLHGDLGCAVNYVLYGTFSALPVALLK